MPGILEISDLSVSYPDGTEALRGVSLAVAPGERVALIGPNGSGKTTVLLAVLGALRSTGKIRVDGVEMVRRNTDEVRSRCGMTFQNPDDQLFMPTLLQDVAFGPLNQGCTPEEAERRARESIAAVGLEGFEGRPAHHASEGQKRNAALATVLSMDVKLLLLDEPGAGLDFRSRQNLVEILSARSEAMILASHDLDMVRRLCEEVVVLDAGIVAARGPVDTILSDSSLLTDHGLG